jgi:hypothetical protein
MLYIKSPFLDNLYICSTLTTPTHRALYKLLALNNNRVSFIHVGPLVAKTQVKLTQNSMNEELSASNSMRTILAPQLRSQWTLNNLDSKILLTNRN